MSQQQTILITGATGTIGKLLLQFLNEKSTTTEKEQVDSSVQETTIRILARNLEKAKEITNQFPNLKFEFFEGDVNQLDSLKDAQQLVFGNVDRLFILTVDSPYKAAIETKLVELTISHSQSSLKQIVKFSALGASVECETNNVLRWQGEAEKSIIKYLKKQEKNSQVSLVLIRPNLFMQNLLWPDELELIKTGALVRPDSNPNTSYQISHVDARDIAELISVILLEKDYQKHANQTYNITGPTVLTYEQVSSLLSVHTGKKIAYQTVPESYYATILQQAHLPNEMVWGMIKLYQFYKWSSLTRLVFGDFEIVMGKPQRSFEQFLSDYQFSQKLLQ